MILPSSVKLIMSSIEIFSEKIGLPLFQNFYYQQSTLDLNWKSIAVLPCEQARQINCIVFDNHALIVHFCPSEIYFLILI